MPTVTVIIPVYKVERYLDACVESVVRQSYADLEILLVDDGSPDRCPALCDAWAEKDPRIKVIHRENGGLSAARNSGIDAAMGEFLLFVDSDDLLEPDAVRRAVDAQRQQDADLVIFNLTYVDEENRPLPQPDFSGFTDEILDEDGVWQRCFALAETRIYYVVAWNKLYRRSLFQHLRYAPGKRYEDQFLLPHLLAQCKTIVCLAAPGLPLRAAQRQHHGAGVEPHLSGPARVPAGLVRLLYPKGRCPAGRGAAERRHTEPCRKAVL